MAMIKREDRDNRQVAMTIEIEKEPWQKALQEAYEKNSALFPVDGVAVGKASRAQLEEAYGSDVFYQEAVNATFPSVLIEAIQKEKLQIAAPPELNVETIGPDGFTFTAVMTLYPEVKLGQYKGLRVVLPPVELSEDDTVEAINTYCRANMIVEHPEKAAMGDEVVMDFEGFVDGQAFEGGKAEMYPLTLGSGMFIPGFEEQVAGIAVDEERDIKVKFPEQYTPELAGKDAVFKIRAHAINRNILPDLTDEYAKTKGFEDASKLRCHIMEQKLQQKQIEAQDNSEDELIQQVVDNMEVEVPDAMVENQLDGLIAELRGQLQSQGAELEQYLEAGGMTMEQLRNQVRDNAMSTVKYELAMNEVARLENIEISDEELEQKYQDMARMYGMAPEQLKKQIPPLRLSHDLKLNRARLFVVNNAVRG